MSLRISAPFDEIFTLTDNVSQLEGFPEHLSGLFLPTLHGIQIWKWVSDMLKYLNFMAKAIGFSTVWRCCDGDFSKCMAFESKTT